MEWLFATLLVRCRTVCGIFLLITVCTCIAFLFLPVVLDLKENYTTEFQSFWCKRLQNTVCQYETGRKQNGHILANFYKAWFCLILLKLWKNMATDIVKSSLFAHWYTQQQFQTEPKLSRVVINSRICWLRWKFALTDWKRMESNDNQNRRKKKDDLKVHYDVVIKSRWDGPLYYHLTASLHLAFLQDNAAHIHSFKVLTLSCCLNHRANISPLQFTQLLCSKSLPSLLQ